MTRKLLPFQIQVFFGLTGKWHFLKSKKQDVHSRMLKMALAAAGQKAFSYFLLDPFLLNLQMSD